MEALSLFHLNMASVRNIAGSSDKLDGHGATLNWVVSVNKVNAEKSL